MRERLVAAVRHRDQTRDEELDDLAFVAPRLAAGKTTTADVRNRPELAAHARPGKLSHADATDSAMSPEQALRYSDWLLSGARVDRRADRAAIDDDGALSQAFTFLDDSRDGMPLPTALAAQLSTALGADLSRVRIHTDQRAAAAAKALHAQAFTIGEDIYFASGAYDPESDAGVQLIAHEVAHVAQAQRGTAGSSRKVSRPDDAHEQQADAFARRFMGRRTGRFETSDPAELVEHVRREAQRRELPFRAELEEHFGASLDFVETYTGPAAELACGLLSAGAFAVRNVVALADPSPRREQLMHELTHIMQMGGRSAVAPGVFERGSLYIGARDSAVEREAERHERQPVQRADANTIHRDPGGSGTSGTSGTADPSKPDPAKAKERVTKFKGQDGRAKIKTDRAKADVQYAAPSGARFEPRYYKSSTIAFSEAQYAPSGVTTRDRADLAKVWAENDATLRLAKVEGTSTYVFTEDGAFRNVVKSVSADPKWKGYKKDLDKLKPPSGAITFKWPKATPTYEQDDPALCTPELDDYREAMRTAVATAYKDTTGQWSHLYDQIVVPQLWNQRIRGDIFEEAVVLSSKDLPNKFGNPSTDQPVFDKVTFPAIANKNNMKGDGTLDLVIQGDHVLMECKAYSGPPTDSVRAQMREYKKVLHKTGYKIKGVIQAVPFDHIAYYVTVPAGTTPAEKTERETTLDKWLSALKATPFNEGEYSLVPKPDSRTVPFKVNFNPSFQFEVETGKKSVQLTNPEINHPGLRITSLNATFDDSSRLTGGTIIYDVNAGDIKKEKNTKPIAPATDGDGGKVDNKLTGLTSKLSEQLPIDIDAAIVDDGIEATLKLKPGEVKGIAGFKVDAAQIKARYTGDGALSAEGTIGLHHDNGKINGTVTLGYDGGWTIDGKVTVSDGFIPGVPSFTCGVSRSSSGDWTLSCDEITIEKTFNAIKLTGTGRNMVYDIKTGQFSGEASIRADLGMFGYASGDATIEHNQLKRAVLSYDSPELKYPAKKSPPTFAGTIGGDVIYDNGKFSGAVRGTANLNVPALRKLAGDGGLGLAVDAQIDEHGKYHGTIRATSPLKFGKYFEIPTLGCTIEADGSVIGDFSIKIKNIKHLEHAEIGCKIDKDGFKVVKADAHASLGKEGDKLWGSLDVGYDEAKGLKITGTLNLKIKEGMVAKGTLTYNSETNAIDVELTVDDITLFDFSKTQNLFKFSKQIPLVSFYSIIGIYLDLGLDLDFQFNMHLGLRPKVKLDGLSFDTWEYNKISAEIELLGQLRAALVATPKVGLGLFAISPELLRGGGGIKVPITGEALLKPTGKLMVGYNKAGGVEGDATLGMQLTFGIRGAVKPYAEAAVLGGAWNPSWTGDSLADFEILPPKELFSFTLDLGGDMKKKEPQIPTAPQAPSAPTAARQLPQEAPKTSTAGNDSPGKDAVPPANGPSGGAADDSVFKMASLTGALKGLPGYAMISGFMNKAGKVWDQIKGFFGRVAKAFKSFFQTIGDGIEEVLNGFAREGLGYLPKLIKKIVGDSVWDVIEPIVTAAAGTAEAILQLFETDPPRGAADFFPWSLKLMQKAFGVAFNSIPAVVSALFTMMNRLAGLAKKIINKMVQDGMIGVKRHPFSIFGLNHFLAATEYKVNILGAQLYVCETGNIVNPSNLVGAALFDALESIGIPATNMQVDPASGDTYRDRWR